MAQGEEGVPHSSLTPRGARFTTITGADWKRSLAAARVRRKGAKERIAKSVKK